MLNRNVRFRRVLWRRVNHKAETSSMLTTVLLLLSIAGGNRGHLCGYDCDVPPGSFAAHSFALKNGITKEQRIIRETDDSGGPSLLM